jgi:hypothetical protein
MAKAPSPEARYGYQKENIIDCFNTMTVSTLHLVYLLESDCAIPYCKIGNHESLSLQDNSCQSGDENHFLYLISRL